MRLRPGLMVLWRSATQVQVGLDPRWATALADLDPTAVRALTGTPPGSNARVLRQRMQDAGVPDDHLEAALRRLAEAQLLTRPAAEPPSSPDHVAWALLDHDGDASELTARRRRAAVRVEGLGRTGSLVATALAAAGVGTVESHGRGRVTPADVGCGITTDDVGAPLEAVTHRLVGATAPVVRTSLRRGLPDLVVLVEHLEPDPQRHLALLADDVAHLSVVVREASVLVGPLVRPGDGPCLRCVDLHRGDVDERWGVIAPQLVVTDPLVLGGQEVALATVAAGLATGQVLGHLDGRPVWAAGGAVEVRLPDMVPRPMRWDRHPDCGCAGLAEMAATRT